MNIIFNIVEPDNVEEFQQRIARWRLDVIKTHIKNSDLLPEQKQAVYQTLKERAIEESRKLEVI